MKDEQAVRPRKLSEMVGQSELRGVLSVAIDAAAQRREMPGHLLFIGPAGTGKTTLALCVAEAIGGGLTELFGTGLHSNDDLVDPLLNLRPRDCIFIDEIHRMWRPAQEALYPVMEDGRLPLANAQVIELPRVGRARRPGSPRPLGFTIMGATTDPERLLSPMLDRFALILRLAPYTMEELAEIAQRTAHILGAVLEAPAAVRMAQASKGIPPVVNRLVFTSRDYARGKAITMLVIEHVLSLPAIVWRMEGRSAQ